MVILLSLIGGLVGSYQLHVGKVAQHSPCLVLVSESSFEKRRREHHWLNRVLALGIQPGFVNEQDYLSKNVNFSILPVHAQSFVGCVVDTPRVEFAVEAILASNFGW